MTAELPLKAVQNACLNINSSKGIILHNDLGSQYTSDLFESYLSKIKMKHCFNREGCPCDNTCIESFHSLLKMEEAHLRTYIDSEDAYDSIFEYIESWYNRTRIHSSLN